MGAGLRWGAALSLARLSPWGLRRAATAARVARPNLSPVARAGNGLNPPTGEQADAEVIDHQADECR